MLKKIATLLVLICLITVTRADNIPSSVVPANIAKAFQLDFSQAEQVQWQRTGQLYKVEFAVERLEHAIWYDVSGEMVQSEVQVMPESLPLNISNAIRTDFANYYIDDEVNRITNSTTYYEVKLRHKRSHLKLKVVFNARAEVVMQYYQ